MAQNSSSSGSSSDFWGSVVDACPNFLGVTVATIGQTLTDVTSGVIDTLTGHGSEVADKLDARAEETARFFDSLGSSIVDRYPNTGAAVAATAVASFPKLVLQFGQGLADSARFGAGFAEGTAGGVVKDVIRALPIVSPAISSLQELRLARLAKVYVDPAPGLGACVPVTITKALRQVGQGRAFGMLDEMVTGLIKSPMGRASLNEGRSFGEMTTDLRRLGARFEFTQTGGTMEGLEKLVRSRPDGVTVFGASWKAFNAVDKTEKTVGHALYSFVDKLGAFRIADRSGQIVPSLVELEKSYRGISQAVVAGGAMYIPKARYLATVANTGGIGLMLNVAKTAAHYERRRAAAGRR